MDMDIDGQAHGAFRFLETENFPFSPVSAHQRPMVMTARGTEDRICPSVREFQRQPVGIPAESEIGHCHRHGLVCD